MENIPIKPAVEVDDLRHAFGKHQALDGVSFAISTGEIFGLLGPNGGGKTTLFRILSTLLRPQNGTARIFGLDVRYDARAVREKIGVVFQSPSLDGRLTVGENLKHQGHLYGFTGERLRKRIDDILAGFKLSDRRNEMASKLSGGLKRRVEIGKGILHSPQLLLMDEPSTGLDPGARRDLWSILKELRDQGGVTILLTTHLMDEAEHCDRVGIMDRGKWILAGTPQELRGAIEGDVISLGTPHPEQLAKKIDQRFGTGSVVYEGAVRVEHEKGHRFISTLFDAFPGEIDSVIVRRPNLEDVFISRTGHRL